MKEKKVNQIYNDILHNIIEPFTGKESTYGNDLFKIGKKLLGVKFRGVYPSNKIPKLDDLTPYAIINLDNSKQPGSHWIAIAKKDNKHELLFYDSFGRDYRRILIDLSYSYNGRIINTDDDKEQKIEEFNCGARSLAFLVFLDKYGWDSAIKI